MATNHLPPFSDANNYRGGFLWKCPRCPGWFSLWRSPTLWEHLEAAHDIRRSVLDHSGGQRSKP